MIIDGLKNWEVYPFGFAWKIAFEFLLSLSPKSDEKTYQLRSDDIIAQVSSYETRFKESAALESHRKYIDIQTIITGEEKIEVSLKNGLAVKEIYDETKDVELYNHSDALTQINMHPGIFVMFFSHDAHMPGLVLREKPELVKKVVVKVKKELLTNI